jgi:hypothetical protein
MRPMPRDHLRVSGVCMYMYIYEMCVCVWYATGELVYEFEYESECISASVTEIA